MCTHETDGPDDWCAACGSYLGLLRRQPGRIAWCIAASITLGAGLFLALAWHAFSPLLHGRPVGQPSKSFWWAFWAGASLLALGLAARQHLQRARRPASPPASPAAEKQPPYLLS